LYSTGKPKAPLAANTRQVSSKPEKILDAPDLVDDFYLHLIDWSSTNHLAVALYDSAFIWNANDGTIAELFSPEEADQEENLICCVSWVEEGSFLAVSNAGGTVDLWDAAESKLLRRMGGHESRVAALSWSQHTLASGCFDGNVHIHDVRVAAHHVKTLRGHSQEVCGLAWAPNDGNYLATGANDNLVLVYDKRNLSVPSQTLNQHQSAVKAMSWCPWHANTLATGGGTSDRSIKFWNAGTGNLLQSVDAGSQVSSLIWHADYRELVSGHGFSHNQLTVWKYPNMTKVADLKGHSSRYITFF
jgi:cell division cycle protein 20 (cofactor of APC complex)